MRAARASLVALPLLLAASIGARAQDTQEMLPDSPGREDTFNACIACHGVAVIQRSRLTRDGWDELMDWMTEKHGMPKLEGEARRVIVDYLARVFPPSAQQRRGANPFLAR